MGLLDKVRDFFYDDEEYEEEIVHKEKKDKKERKIKFEKPEKKEKIDIEPKRQKNETQTISDRELFKAERTFNFPFNMDDDFDEEEKQKPKEDNLEAKEKVETKKYTTRITSYNDVINQREKAETPKIEKEEKKFKPTPVISPIYGILDKNYKKEDLLIDSSLELSKTKKINYESVRKRAYPKMYDTKEENETSVEDEKGIFYNLDDEDKESKNEDDEVKIIYNDVEFEDNEEAENDNKNITIGERIEKYEKKLEKEKEADSEEKEENEDDAILSETKEQDLFNLIDNMYNSEEEDEEEE